MARKRRLKPLKESQDYIASQAIARQREKFHEKSFESKIYRGGKGYPYGWSGPLTSKSGRKAGRQARAYRLITAKAVRDRKHSIKTKTERRAYYKKVSGRVAGLHEIPGWGRGARPTWFGKSGETSVILYAKIAGYEKKRKGMRYPELQWEPGSPLYE